MNISRMFCKQESVCEEVGKFKQEMEIREIGTLRDI